MIVVPLLVSAVLGFAIRPAPRAQLAVGLLTGLLGAVLWFTAAHDDGESGAFAAALAGLWALSAVVAAGGSYVARRPGR